MFHIILKDLFVENALVEILYSYWDNFMDLIHDKPKLNIDKISKCYQICYIDEKLFLFYNSDSYNYHAGRYKRITLKNIHKYNNDFYVLNHKVEYYDNKLYFDKQHCTCDKAPSGYGSVFRLNGEYNFMINYKKECNRIKISNYNYYYDISINYITKILFDEIE